MDVSDLGSILSNPTRVRLIRLLSTESYSATEAYEVYNRSFEPSKHRESIYRELEKLVESGLVEKSYSESSKRLEYSLQYSAVSIDLANSDVELTEL